MSESFADRLEPVYVRVSNYDVDRTEEVVPGLVFIDYNEGGVVVGVEVTVGVVERAAEGDE